VGFERKAEDWRLKHVLCGSSQYRHSRAVAAFDDLSFCAPFTLAGPPQRQTSAGSTLPIDRMVDSIRKAASLASLTSTSESQKVPVKLKTAHYRALAALRDGASGTIMKSHLCVAAMLFFLAVGTLLAQPVREQAPDRPANSNAAPGGSTPNSDSSVANEKVYQVGHGVTAPHHIYTPEPEYTNRARKKKLQGTVLVALVLTAEGTPRDVTVTKKLDPDLDNKAVEAVRSWRFEPATKDGEPVPVHLQVEVQFRLY